MVPFSTRRAAVEVELQRRPAYSAQEPYPATLRGGGEGPLTRTMGVGADRRAKVQTARLGWGVGCGLGGARLGWDVGC